MNERPSGMGGARAWYSSDWEELCLVRCFLSHVSPHIDLEEGLRVRYEARMLRHILIGIACIMAMERPGERGVLRCAEEEGAGREQELSQKTG